MMEEMYGHPPDGSFTAGEELHRLIAAAGYGVAAATAEVDMKARIASHPRYPHLLEAYIDCQKVGAPPDIASVLDEIRREKAADRRGAAPNLIFGADPELDEFMEMYCAVLVKYRRDLAQPFDEATAFLNTMEIQLSHLCKPAACSPPSLAPFISGK